MKKLYLPIILLFVFIQVNWGQTFFNGTFESWTSGTPDGWTLSPISSRISFSQSANNEGRVSTGYALKIIANSNSTGTDGSFEAIVTGITAGDDYGNITIYTKSVGGNNNIWVRFWDTRWLDNSNTQVGTDLDASAYSSGDNTDWKAYSVALGTAPTNATKLRVNIRVYIQSGFTSGDFIWLDDLTINGIILPVELTSFTATAMNNGIMLNWSTATEVNNYGFSVERKSSFASGNESGDSFYKWQKIGFVEGHGNSNSPNDYSFLDSDLLTGKVSYRLKQVDTDGEFEYSDVVTVNSNKLAKYELYQNHPNPFNPSTVVSFSLPEMSHVRLTVYNAIGQEVAKLVDREMEAGYHNVNFDGSNLASGLYLYRLETPNYSKTMKMILLR